MSDTNPLHVRLRPETLADVVGQDAVTKSIATLFEKDRVPHTFLFTGPSGCGKTTLARIIARMLECDPATGIVQVDAARYSGADQMRELIKQAQYGGLGANSRRLYIIDECHSASKQAWQALLLATEEPPSHLYWVFCTTESEKVPNTIRTRAHAYDLKPVKWDLLSEYLGAVLDAEGLKVKSEFVDLAARKANGSVRQGLVFLSVLDGITDKEEALRLLESAELAEGGAAIDLARMLVSNQGFTWSKVRKLFEQMQDESPEGIRMTVIGYCGAALLKTDSEAQAQRLCAIMQAFMAVRGERLEYVMLATCSLMFSGE